MLANRPDSPYARAVRALTTYIVAIEGLLARVRSVGSLDNLTSVYDGLAQVEQTLGRVDADLVVAAKHAAFHLDLCPACWKRDWNQNGRITRADQRLLAIEYDAKGRRLNDSDPRMRPTFRLDHGDVLWARTYVMFQRALINFALKYDWRNLREIERRGSLTFEVIDASRGPRAHRLILRGLQLSDRARAAYLAEVDDRREWLPNPRQKQSPFPLPVDAALYDTWAKVVDDVRQLLMGRTGLPVGHLLRLGLSSQSKVPIGYINLKTWLLEPHRLRLGLVDLALLRSQPTTVLHRVFGKAYEPAMRPTPLVKRMHRRQREIRLGTATFANKLRYLLWVN